jgi:WD40 repeat protein
MAAAAAAAAAAARAAPAEEEHPAIECAADEDFQCPAKDERTAMEAELIEIYREHFEEEAPDYVRKCLRQLAFPESVKPADRESRVPAKVKSQADSWKRLCLDIRQARLFTLEAHQREQELAKLAETETLGQRTLKAFDAGSGAGAGARGGSVDWGTGSVEAVEAVQASCGQTRVLKVCVRSDGKGMVTTDGNGAIKWWVLRSGRRVGEWGRLSKAARWEVVKQQPAHRGETRGVCLSGDESLVVTSCNQGAVKLWRGPGEAVCTLREAQAEPLAVHDVTFSADGRRVIAAGYFERALLVFDVASRSLETTVPAGTGLRSVDASADGQWIATGGWSGNVQLWEADRLAKGARLQGAGSGDIWGVRFSPDSKHVAAVSWDGHLRVWDVSDGSRPTMEIEAHDAPAYCAGWSGDGKQIITTGGAGLVKVWDWPGGGGLIRTLTGHHGMITGEHTADAKTRIVPGRDAVYGVGTSHAGDMIASTGFHQGPVLVWHHKPGDAAAASSATAW